MANTSYNQVRQIYVIKDGYSASSVSAASNVGTIGNVTAITEGMDKEVYFLYKGAKDVLRSDFIPVKNITYAKAIDAADMASPLNKVEVTLKDSINDGAPVPGKDYVLGINFKGFFSSGDASQYYKDAAVHVDSSMDTAKKFFDAMKSALNLAFSREEGATATTNPYLTFTVVDAAGSDPAKLVIEEVPQDWILGTMKQTRIQFDVFPGEIYTDDDDTPWGTATNVTATNTNKIGNGKKIADLEWCCLGERGDQYRGMGYPNTIHTEYLVDSSSDYHVLELHFAFTDTGVNSYRTEKEITVVAPTDKKAALNSFIGAINTNTGLQIATIS